MAGAAQDFRRETAVAESGGSRGEDELSSEVSIVKAELAGLADGPDAERGVAKKRRAQNNT